jgi:hypothetical protein
LEKAQEQQEANGEPSDQPPPGEQPPPPLVPESAELKLLKSAQLRVNRRTQSFDKAKPAELNAPLVREVQRIADRQEEVRQMAEDIYERP